MSRLLNFNNAVERGDFDDFCIRNSPILLPLTYACVDIAVGSGFILTAIVHEWPIYMIFIRSLRFIPTVLLLVHLVGLWRARCPNSRVSVAFLVMTGNAFIVTASTVSTILLVVSTFPCDAEVYGCEENVLKIVVVLPVIFTPILRTIMVKCHRPAANIYSSAMQIVSVVLLFTRVNCHPLDIFAVSIFVVFSCWVLYEYEVSLRRVFAVQFNLEEFITSSAVMMEHEAHMKETQAKALRRLIGGVAHDLKSPLHAIGLELDTLVQSCGSRGTHEVDDVQLTISHGQLLESVNLLKSVCSFMLMSINRAIDYTKVSTGITLVPAMETVDVYGAMTWAVKCNESSSKSTYFEMQPLPPGLSQFIITDKQWLMENLLCLLSNAQKFTAEGVITVACSLTRAADTSANKQMSSYLVPEETIHQPMSLESVTHQNTPKGEKYKPHNQSIHPECAPIEPKQVNCESSFDEESGIVHPRDIEVPSMRSTGDDLYVLIEVVDSGIGLSQEEQRELFLPLKQTQHCTGGTGLGLFSMAKRVESLGGSCGVSNRLDGQRGCRFWFAVPYRPDEVRSPAVNSEQRRPRCFRRATSDSKVLAVNTKLASSAHWKCSLAANMEHKSDTCPVKRRSLLVEDSLIIQKTTLRIMQLEGYHMDVANNGMECLKLLERYSYDFVLMDIQMPVLDGLETTRRIRAKEALQAQARVCTMGSASPRGLFASGSRLCIIAVSADSDSHSEAEAMSAGFDAYFSKPLSIAALKARLTQWGLE